MLVLERRLRERIRIGDDIIIEIDLLQPGKVRLAIDAPKNVPVYREEVYQRIKAEKAADSR